ncbi:MAG: Rpn family recombination-promoting nuclease/putative transposase [Treponemataceae bacterium]
MLKETRNNKDSVFTDLFAKDEKAKLRFMNLYNALFNKNLQDESQLKNVTLENVIFSRLKNDIAYVVENRLLVLLEHQSTINENMPLRCLLYVAREYEELVDAKKRYARLVQEIPTPEFFALYNGVEKYPLKTQLKLSDAFTEKAKPKLELVVTVININAEVENELLQKCTYLNEYALFVKMVRDYKKLDKENGFVTAIKECIKQGILKEYLERKAREVISMLSIDYDYDTDVAVQVEEAREVALQEGLLAGRYEGAHQKALETAKAFKEMGLPISQISRGTGLSTEEIERL